MHNIFTDPTVNKQNIMADTINEVKALAKLNANTNTVMQILEISYEFNSDACNKFSPVIYCVWTFSFV